MNLNQISIYELYIDKFALNIKGLIDKLSYFTDLGITHLWLLPYYPSPMVDEGYDVSDYFGIRNDLGTIQDFELLLKKADRIGLKIIVDWVINHTSIEHSWFKQASQSTNNPKRDYYLWSKNGTECKRGINAFPQLKKSNWITNPNTNDYYYATFYPQQADLNWDNPLVFEEMSKYLKFWINMGVAGFRADAVSHMIKRENTDCYNLPEVHVIMKQFRKYFDTNYPQTLLLAEASGKKEQIKEYFGSSDEFQLVFNFALTRQLYFNLINNSLEQMPLIVKNNLNIPKNCAWVNVLTNHDAVCMKELPKLKRSKVLNFIDPKNEYTFIKNESTAVRLATAFKNNPELLMSIWQNYLDLPGIPVIYYGEEIEMQNLKLRHRPLDSRMYVRNNFNWTVAKANQVNPRGIFSLIKSKLHQRVKNVN